MKSDLPPLPAGLHYRLDLAKHVTPRLIAGQPVHRWFYFPHSYSPQLVDLLLDEWHLPPDAVVVDPFVGAGTTVVAAARRGLDAIGTDVSPLSIFVSQAKLRRYDPARVRAALQEVIASAGEGDTADLTRTERLARAFTDDEFALLVGLRTAIQSQAEDVRPLLMLALLHVQRQISRAKPDGGWFRWIERENQAATIIQAFTGSVSRMLDDLADAPPLTSAIHQVLQHDARQIEDLASLYPEIDGRCRAIITSPPYPNRHDYSRIFQIELLTLGLQEADIFSLRYGSIRSNVEARVPNVSIPRFHPPSLLIETLDSLPSPIDKRIKPMLCGYFEDMNAVLHSSYGLLARDSYVALVVGNVRHAGTMIPVDEILMQMGENLGYEPQTSWVARLRGNSAQQMGRFGREPARESIAILRKP